MTHQLLEHASLAQFSVQNDCLQIGGMALTRLADRVGTTPFYAYDRKKITERVELLRQKLPREILLHYAIKANPMAAVVQHLAGLVDGMDVASIGEMRVALDTVLAPEKISFAGPGKKMHELRSAIAAGVIVNVESQQEMELIAQQGRDLGITPKVAIRVNPDFELKSSGMKMSGGPKPFGIDAEYVPVVLKQLGLLGLDFMGFHVFSGSQNLSAVAIQEAHEKTVQLAIQLADYAPSPVKLLNIGGGFGVPYFPGDQPLDIAAIGVNLQHLMQIIKQQLPNATVALELGRYLVAEAGIYVCRVLERKMSRGQVFLVTDGGLHHHLAASGNLGQVIRKNYPVIIGNKVQGATREIVSVVGPLCTPLDLLADQMPMAAASVDDLVVVLQSGAYGLTASPTAFLDHPPPIEVLV
ncbi:pyridoxal-dependent decarboxylase, exosortase A system-associated [Nitrosomonas supralitoralis]|uniref:Pyridoxal-dependent decarboxylase, exosortase A system-associated n=1 Tax=Nitrosomonas supralitoralis TaxID=2116706 RepID=A0A2P7NS25_9PROT|nr:pyridoxal-dependent decarboxylase, exosortase A system-associated [Nitrosomonas supralitoralis]PSJ16267.1 pyridoxal-dependent decarboxylase, exosortase A system-associated [Nitrosomonas supralitoralis]